MPSFVLEVCYFFFFKQKTAYEMRISDWSSDVCSSDLVSGNSGRSARSSSQVNSDGVGKRRLAAMPRFCASQACSQRRRVGCGIRIVSGHSGASSATGSATRAARWRASSSRRLLETRSEEHTSELQSLMRISYAVFCLKKQKTYINSLQHNNGTN